MQDAVAWFGYDAGSYSEYRGPELLHFSYDLDCALIRMAEASRPVSPWHNGAICG